MSRPRGYHRGVCPVCSTLHAVSQDGTIWRHDAADTLGTPANREGRPVCRGSGKPAVGGSVTTVTAVRWSPTRPRGTCPVCGRQTALTPTGLLWWHRTGTRRPGGRYPCPGWATTPVDPADLVDEQEGSSL